MSDSMIYTIGTALNRAKDNGVPVEVLVEGMWIRGQVLAVDGFGVVLHVEEDEHSVIRIESISAVTICSAAPRPSAAHHQAARYTAIPERTPVVSDRRAAHG
jgi:sRNA-binding regulator protein Hfq